MANSRQIAGLLGPVLSAVLISESPLVQPHLYDAQIPPVVYLSGTLFLCSGLGHRAGAQSLGARVARSHHGNRLVLSGARPHSNVR